jgi:serine protease Do
MATMGSTVQGSIYWRITMNLFRPLLALVTVAGLAGSGATGFGVAPAQAAPNTLTDASIPDVAERVIDSVVNISSARAVRGGPADSDPFFNDPDSPSYQRPSTKQAKSKGSGVIVNASGRILTNAHVVNGADEILVTLHDGAEMTAKLVGIDNKADLAVIQLKGNVPKLKPLPLGDSDQLRLGEVVLAIGDPFGVGKSVTMGIVSAKGRGNMGIEEYEDFIQTDAAINPGNSGGALVNLRGELVGINTAIASKSGGYAGIGFAIPTSMAKPIMDMLVRDGKVVRGYLGVSLVTVTQAIASEYKLTASRGAAVAGVQDGSPAHKAGLQEGDVITALNGSDIKSSDTLRNSIAMIKPGTTIELAVSPKSGQKKLIKAKLAQLPETPRR